MDDLYEYTPFTDTNSIRLLIIQPLLEDKLLAKCQLRIVSLDALPAFEALSYTWGSPTRSHQVFIDGKRLTITSNLIEALIGVQQESEVRVLWADAICINQNDVQERAQQVQLMSTIYHKPTQVLIWLGPETGDTLPALNLLKKMFQAAMQESASGTELTDVRLPTFKSPEHWGLPSFDQPEWESLIRFFLRPWFKRVWVVQEVRVASSAMVMIGKIEAHWLLIYIACSWFVTNNYMLALNDSPIGADAGVIHLPSRIGCHRFVGQDLHRLPLSRVLRKMRAHAATDPRDRIFALVELSNEAGSQSPRILPDYSKSMAHVYRDASRFLIENGSLDILSAVSWVPDNRSPLTYETTQISIEGATVTKSVMVWGPPDESLIFVSWVPRWDSPDIAFPFTDDPENKEFYSASGDLQLETIPSSDEDALLLRGVIFDSTKLQTDLKLPTDVYKKPMQYEEYEAWKLMALKADSYPSAMRLAAFHVTLTAGLTLNQKPVESETQHQANILAFKAKMAQEGGTMSENDSYTTDGDGSASDYMHLVLQKCSSRRLFTTSKGYMGLGPQGMLPGDTVCIFFGGLTPYVLRNELSSWRFIGECYVHGIMHGEAVQGLGNDTEVGETFEIR